MEKDGHLLKQTNTPEVCLSLPPRTIKEAQGEQTPSSSFSCSVTTGLSPFEHLQKPEWLKGGSSIRAT